VGDPTAPAAVQGVAGRLDPGRQLAG